jgi:hypothetical protein
MNNIKWSNVGLGAVGVTLLLILVQAVKVIWVGGLWDGPHEKPQVVQASVQEVARPVRLPSSPSECLDFTGTPKIGKYEILIKNKCTVEIPSVKVYMKFYDADNNRIGWADNSINKMPPGESVRWPEDYPEKDYPLTKDQVKSIRLDHYK